MKSIFKALPDCITSIRFISMSINDRLLKCLCHYCPWMTSLELHHCSDVTPSGISHVMTSLLNLDKFALSWSTDPNEQILNLIVKAYSSKLKHLTLNGFTSFTDVSLSYAITALKDTLQYLDFEQCREVSDKSLITLGSNCRLLRSINCSHCDAISDKGLGHLVRSCSELRHINISYCPAISNVSLQIIAESSLSSQLLELHANGIRSVTDADLMTLISHCLELRTLSLIGTSVTSLPPHILALSGLKTLLMPESAEKCLGADPAHKAPLLLPPEQPARYGLLRQFPEYDIRNRKRVFLIGNPKSGKSSLIASIMTSLTQQEGDNNSFPLWRINMGPSDQSPDGMNMTQFDFYEISGEQIDFLSALFTSEDIYVIVFDATDKYADQVIMKYIGHIQCKVPGCSFIVVATHVDQVSSKVLNTLSRDSLIRAQDSERHSVRRITNEIDKLSSNKKSEFNRNRIDSLGHLKKMRPMLPSKVINVDARCRDSVHEQFGQRLLKCMQSKSDESCLTPQVIQLLQYVFDANRKQKMVMSWADFVCEAVDCDGIIADEDLLLDASVLLQSKGLIQIFHIHEPDVNHIYVVLNSREFWKILCNLHCQNQAFNENAITRSSLLSTKNPAAVMRALERATEGVTYECFLPFLILGDQLFDERQTRIIIKLLCHLHLLVPLTSAHIRSATYMEAIQVQGYEFLSSSQLYRIPLLYKHTVSSTGIHWPVRPFEDDVQITWRLVLANQMHAGIVTSLGVAMESAAILAGAQSIYKYQGGTIYTLDQARARVNISANSIDVSFRCLPDIIDAPSTQHLQMEPEAPSVAVQYMWAKVIPLIYALHLRLDSDYPGVFHQVYIGASGKLFHRYMANGTERALSLYSCIEKLKSPISTIQFLDGGSKISLDIKQVLPPLPKEATDLTSWLKGLYERRSIVTALSEHYFSDLKASQGDGIPLSSGGRPLVHSVQCHSRKVQWDDGFMASEGIESETNSTFQPTEHAATRTSDGSAGAITEKRVQGSVSKTPQLICGSRLIDASTNTPYKNDERNVSISDPNVTIDYVTIAADLVSMAIGNAMVIHHGMMRQNRNGSSTVVDTGIFTDPRDRHFKMKRNFQGLRKDTWSRIILPEPSNCNSEKSESENKAKRTFSSLCVLL